MDCMTPSPPGTMCLARTTPPGNYTVPVKVCDQGNVCSELLVSVLAEKCFQDISIFFVGGGGIVHKILAISYL